MIVDDYSASVHVFSDKLAEMKAVFERLATGVEQAYLAPAADGWMALYPRQGDTAPRWAEAVSREMKCVAVAFQVIEDAVFTYHLYEKGALKDCYVSRPSHLYGHNVSREKSDGMRGKPEVWEEHLKNGRTTGDLGRLLGSCFESMGPGRATAEYIIPSTLLEEFAAIVGIRGAAANFASLQEEMEEWREDVELAEEDDEPMESRDTCCDRPAEKVDFARAPRKARAGQAAAKAAKD